MPGASQNVVPAGLFAVALLTLLSPGLTTTAPAGAVVGPLRTEVLPQICAGGVAGAPVEEDGGGSVVVVDAGAVVVVVGASVVDGAAVVVVQGGRTGLFA